MELKVLLVMVAALMSIVAALVAGIVMTALGNGPTASVAAGGATFAGSIAIILSLMTALDLFRA